MRTRGWSLPTFWARRSRNLKC